MEETTNLATEILKELKTTNKRMFIALCISFAINIAVVGGFLWYISLPTEEYTVDQDTNEGGSNYNIRGDYHGEAEDNIQAQGGQKQETVNQ